MHMSVYTGDFTQIHFFFFMCVAQIRVWSIVACCMKKKICAVNFFLCVSTVNMPHSKLVLKIVFFWPGLLPETLVHDVPSMQSPEAVRAPYLHQNLSVTTKTTITSACCALKLLKCFSLMKGIVVNLNSAREPMGPGFILVLSLRNAPARGIATMLVLHKRFVVVLRLWLESLCSRSTQHCPRNAHRAVNKQTGYGETLFFLFFDEAKTATFSIISLITL